MAGGLSGDAGAARESCDINGTSQTRKRSKSDLFFPLKCVMSDSLLKSFGVKPF